MKKELNLLVAFLLLSITTATAQTTGSTTVKVQLQDVMSLKVNDPEVLLTFASTKDYEEGVSAPKNSHLTVTSNKPYNVKVSAGGNLAAATTANGTLDAGVVLISFPNTGNNTALGGTIKPAAALTTTEQELITGAAAVVEQNIDVIYAVPATISRTNKILGKNADTYSTVVTYTISQ